MFFGIVSILSIVGMIIGNKIQHTIDDHLLKQWFGYFILVMGWFIILKELIL
jgi:uncharacterized membrane protein YfcA